MTQCSSGSMSCAAPVPTTTGATASGRVRRRAAPIQSPAVIGGASTIGRFAGLPLVRTGFRFAVDLLRFEDAATLGILVGEPITSCVQRRVKVMWITPLSETSVLMS